MSPHTASGNRSMDTLDAGRQIKSDSIIKLKKLDNFMLLPRGHHLRAIQKRTPDV